MKAIKVGGEYRSVYYLLPEDFDSMDAFIEYISPDPNQFIKLTKLSEKTAFPYFIEEDSREVFVRFAMDVELGEVDVTLLKKEEYTARLLKLVKTVCVGCGNYSDQEEALGEIGNLRGHWNNLCLDGYCNSFWRAANCDDDE